MKIRKPILVGGVGLSMVLWGISSGYGAIASWGEDAVMPLMLFGGGLWWLRQQLTKPKPKAQTEQLETIRSQDVAAAIAHAQDTLAYLQTEIPEAAAEFTPQMAAYSQPEAARSLTGAVTGSADVGKTHLVSHLDEHPSAITWAETHLDNIPANADLLLWLVTGDLTASELTQLQELRQLHHHVCVVLTKQDQRPAAENDALRHILHHRLTGLCAPEDIVAIAAAPQAIQVRRHQEDGSTQAATATPEPQLTELSDRLTQLTAQKVALQQASQWRQIRNLTQQMRDRLNQVRRKQAIPIVERYQWLAAGSAIANPVAALDLLVTVAINAQMLVDLGAVYRHPFSLNQAQTATRELGQLLIKLGAVELSTQTLSHLGKSTPLTYLAGGAVQGTSAAYLTRIVGLSLMDYFAEQDPLTAQDTQLNFTRLQKLMTRWLTQTQRTELLRNCWTQVQRRFKAA